MAVKAKNFEGESHEQLVSRVKRELIVTMITAVLAMAIGYLAANLI